MPRRLGRQHGPTSTFFPSVETMYVDPEEALELGVLDWEYPEEHRLELLEELRQAVMADTEAEAQVAAFAMGFEDQIPFPPAGSSGKAWLQHVMDLMTAPPEMAIRLADDFEGGQPGKPLVRVSKFTDLDTANAATTAAVRAHADQIGPWEADPGGHLLLSVYAELPHSCGTVMRLVDEQTVREPAHGVVVTFHRPIQGGIGILNSYPEEPLDRTWRDRFPDLCHVFGGYLGQDFDRTGMSWWEGGLWSASWAMMRRTGEPARQAIHAQLGELLALGDEDVRAALHALGSYYVPRAPRARDWLRRQRWMLYGLPWEVTQDDWPDRTAVQPAPAWSIG